MSDLVESYKKLAERYLDVTLPRSQADEAKLLGELDTLWWQMSLEEREVIDLWNETERGKE